MERLSDLAEFMRDAAGGGIGFFALSTLQYHMHDTAGRSADRERTVRDGDAGC